MRLIFQWITICSIVVIFAKKGDAAEIITVWTEEGQKVGCQGVENDARQLKENLKKLQEQSQQDKASISQAISALSAANDKAQGSIDAMLIQIKSLSGADVEYATSKQTIQTLTVQLQEVTSVNIQLQVRITTLKQQVTTLTVTSQQGADQVAKLRAQLQELKASNDKKEADLVVLRARILALGDVKGQLDNSKAELSSLQQQLQQNQNSLSQCNTQLTNLNSQNGVCQSDVTAEQQKLNDIPPAGCSLPRRSGGRCAGKFVRWIDVWGKHDVSFDVATANVNSVDQCRQACLARSDCESADYLNYVCYLNGRRDSLQNNNALLFLNFECC